MEAELEHDLGSVCLDSPDSDPQKRSDLFIPFPFCQEADDFDLARSRSGACQLTLLFPTCGTFLVGSGWRWRWTNFMSLSTTKSGIWCNTSEPTDSELGDI
jgi:hypothetical protein